MFEPSANAAEEHLKALAKKGARLILSPCAWAVPPDHDQVRDPYGSLWRDVYGVIVGEMIEEKQEILDSDLSTREAIGEWVRLTYAYYDGNRDAFTYVLLLPHPFAEAMGDEYHAQGRLFERLIRRGHRSGDVDRSMKPGLARAMFVGLFLSVPSQINEGGLKGPASGYAEEVTRAVVRALGVA